MNRNEEITSLAEEIMLDTTNSSIPLHNSLLKASRLSLLVDIPANVSLFKEWAQYAEQNSFIIGSFNASIDAAKDHDVAISSANPNQHVMAPWGNTIERNAIRTEAKQIINYLAKYRAETYNFALGIYTKWKFGNIAESIFERKRRKIEPVLREIFPDVEQRLNSIEQNIRSTNAEDWKSAVVSCRTLFIDIADVINPPRSKEEKEKYINRLKEFISPKITGSTKKNLLESCLEEVKIRLELTVDSTQGSAHSVRPKLPDAENIVLYTYLIIADLLEIYIARKVK